MRLIDADKLGNAIAGHSKYSGDSILSRIYCMAEGKEIDNPITPLDEERQEGKWIMHIDNLFPEDSSQECNKCHEHQQLLGDDNYCPNCGAKMIGIETDYVLVKEESK